MEELIKLLENPFDDVTTEETFQEKCKKIATKLFKDYCINCNGKTFYFAEIEFYYYKEGVWEKNWNSATYPRDFKGKCGQLFYHLSGVDICFDGNLKKENSVFTGKGGGILIRSIVNSSNNSLIVGPLTCANTLLNACDGKNMPSVRPLKESHNYEIMQTYRFFGDEDFAKIENGTNRDGELKLAFFDSKIDPNIWNKARSKYSKRLQYDKKI